jgi:hypothetical protein
MKYLLFIPIYIGRLFLSLVKTLFTKIASPFRAIKNNFIQAHSDYEQNKEAVAFAKMRTDRWMKLAGVGSLEEKPILSKDEKILEVATDDNHRWESPGYLDRNDPPFRLRNDK